MTTLLIATRNAHKVGEIRAVLGAAFRYLSLREFPGAPTVVEDAETFAGNATRKSVGVAAWVALSAGDRPEDPTAGPLYVLADDSGLEVDALHGAPGVHSARFAAIGGGAASNAPDAANNRKLLTLLRAVPLGKRTARFRCVLALTPAVVPAPQNRSPVCSLDESEFRTEIFEGTCEGRIELSPRGPGGFGYDPLFAPDGYDQTFAELGEVIKNGLSHRARALEQLKGWLTGQAPGQREGNPDRPPPN